MSLLQEVKEHKELSILDWPSQVLHRLWIHIDDPEQFRLTCQAFNELSKRHDARLSWLLSWGNHWAIFKAITRKGLLSPKLIVDMIEQGAILSRSLCQEVAHRFYAAGNYLSRLQLVGRWGTNLPFETFVEIMDRGNKLYGPLLGDPSEFDASRFWRLASSDEAVDVTALELSIKEYAFTPLPVAPAGIVTAPSSKHSWPTCEALLESAIVKMPRLAQLFTNSGFHLTHVQKDRILQKSFASATHADKKSLLEHLLELLQLREVNLEITEAIAISVILGLSHVEVTVVQTTPPQPRFHHASTLSRVAQQAYDALRELHQRGGLSFDLEDLIKRLAAYFAKNLHEERFRYILSYLLSKDESLLQHLGQAKWLYVWKMRFLKDLHKHLSLERIREVCSDLTISDDDVIQALWSVETGADTEPLDYRAKWLRNDSWDGFFQRLIHALLLRPFKGDMLLAVRIWAKEHTSCAFDSILEQATLSHRIPHDIAEAIGPERWSVSTTETPWMDPCYEFDSPLPLTTLGYDVHHNLRKMFMQRFGNDVGLDSEKFTLHNPIVAEVPDFCIATKDQSSEHTAVSRHQEQEVARETTGAYGSLELMLQSSKSAIDEHLSPNYSTEVYHRSRNYAAKVPSDELIAQKILTKCKPMALALIEIFGPTSNCARVVVDHIVVSQGRKAYSWDVKQEGRDLPESSGSGYLLRGAMDKGIQLTQWHIQVLLSFGKALPSRIESEITSLQSSKSVILHDIRLDRLTHRSTPTKYEERHVKDVIREAGEINSVRGWTVSYPSADLFKPLRVQYEAFTGPLLEGSSSASIAARDNAWQPRWIQHAKSEGLNNPERTSPSLELQSKHATAATTSDSTGRPRRAAASASARATSLLAQQHGDKTDSQDEDEDDTDLDGDESDHFPLPEEKDEVRPLTEKEGGALGVLVTFNGAIESMTENARRLRLKEALGWYHFMLELDAREAKKSNLRHRLKLRRPHIYNRAKDPQKCIKEVLLKLKILVAALKDCSIDVNGKFLRGEVDMSRLRSTLQKELQGIHEDIIKVDFKGALGYMQYRENRNALRQQKHVEKWYKKNDRAKPPARLPRLRADMRYKFKVAKDKIDFGYGLTWPMPSERYPDEDLWRQSFWNDSDPEDWHPDSDSDDSDLNAYFTEVCYEQDEADEPSAAAQSNAQGLATSDAEAAAVVEEQTHACKRKATDQMADEESKRPRTRAAVKRAAL